MSATGPISIRRPDVDLGLTGKGALVTGGSRGLGRAVAAALVHEGATVVVLGRDSEALDDAVASTGATGRVIADTTDDAAVRAAVAAAVEQIGRLDVVVNCAAPRSAAAPAPGLAGIDDAELLHHVDTKVLGYARMARAALPHLLLRVGSIVNVGGTRARNTGSVTGSVRNLGVVALSKNLADELGPRGIAVACVHPGYTVTERTRNDEAFLAAATRNALGRPITADEVACLITFLASPRGRLTNGAVVIAAGGDHGGIWA